MTIFQTDAAITVATRGAAVQHGRRGDGANTATWAPNGGSIGNRFLDASNVVTRVVTSERIWTKNAPRVGLGVRIQDVTRDVAGDPDGACQSKLRVGSTDVPKVPPRRPAVKPGDVILSLRVSKVERYPVSGPFRWANGTVGASVRVWTVLPKGKSPDAQA